MSKITNQELTLLRTQPHSTKLWLSIYQPPTVFAARVNDVDIAKGEYEITYDSLSAGSRLLVEAGMTLWVGSAAGLDDYGKVRVRSITASVVTIAENDHINWADNLYLTIVSFYEINAIYPRIIQDPADELNVIFYKDYDIAYSNQNTVLGSFVNMGPHHAGFLEGGTHSVYYSASGTSNLKSDALTYAWFFQGGTVTGSTSQTPGNINYTSPGQYTTRLVVSNASGGTDTSYRHVSIYDRPENGSNNPILLWSLEQLTGAKENGGYNGRVKIRQSISNTLLKDGSLVVIFADDSYGGTNQSIGGNAQGRAKIVFVGYVIDGSIEYDYADSSVEFDMGSPTEIMKISEGFSISVESKAAPATWYELLNMNIKRALYHYLKWHSTFPMTNDVSFLGTDQNIQFFDADRESLYDALHTLISTALIGGSTCDRQGKLWFEVNGYTAGITLETNFTLDSQDWIGKPEIDQQQNNQISFIETGGIAYDGPTLNTFTALLSSAPGDAPAYKGKLNRFQGLALASQAQLNTLVGDIFAYQNSEFPLSSFSLAGNYRNFDLAPQEDILINMGAAQNVRGISFFGKKFLVTNIDWVYLSREEFFYPLISFVEDTQGFDGDTIIIPDVPPVEGDPAGGGGSFDVPPFNVPPLPFTDPPSGSGGSITQIGFASHSGNNFSTFEDSDFDMILNNVHVDPDGYITDGNAKIPIQGGGLYHVTADIHYYRTSIGDAKVVEFSFRLMNYKIGALELIFPTTQAYSVGKVGVSSSIPMASATLTAIVDGNLYDTIAFSSIAAVDINWSRIMYVTIMRLNG